MTESNKKAKDFVMDAIKKQTFTPAEILSQYSSQDIAAVISEIIYEKRVKGDDKIALSEVELQNIYLLTSTLLTKNMIDRTATKTVSNTKQPSKQKRVALFDSGLLDSLYKLQPA